MNTVNPEHKKQGDGEEEAKQILARCNDFDYAEAIAYAGELYGSLLTQKAVIIYQNNAKKAADKLIESMRKCIHDHIDYLLLAISEEGTKQ